MSVTPIRRTDGRPGTYRLTLQQAVGYAHGHVAYANKLRIDDIQTTRLPLTVLVEMGKHATSPDRNADGRFTPGVDVTMMVGDAWGVRDSFGFNYLGQVAYSSWMTLSRTNGRKAHPEGDQIGPRAWTYQLRNFTNAAKELLHQPSRPPADFLPFLENHHYESAPSALSRPLIGWLGGNRSLRWDLGPGLVVAGAPGVQMPLVGGYPILALGAGWRTEGTDGAWGYVGAHYTPSVMGYASWYAGVGGYFSHNNDPEIGPELGLKLRVPVKRPTGPVYLGLRVGLRAVEFSTLDESRLIVEFGKALF